MRSQPAVVARLVHLSDLHFGLKDEGSVWPLLHDFICRLKPTAVFITGDIVNTPKEKLFNEATAKLSSFTDIPLFVCPGNHDRYLFGNAFGFWKSKEGRGFFYFLQKWLITAPQVRVLDLGPRITARITAIDSSDKASFFARSFVDSGTFAALRQAFKEEQMPEEKGKLNLRVVLTHHHLLPLPATEGRKDRLFGPFQAATTLTVNAGAVLNVLSQAHVDLALHGHEHVFNVAKYTTMENRLGNVTVIAAGSSTGTVTAKGWQFDKVGFNVLEVYDDDSIWLLRYRGKNGEFTVGERHQLFEAVDLRRARFYLTHREDESEAEAQGVKIHFRYLENRDAIVHRSYANAKLTDNKFAFSAMSQFGQPTSPRAWLVDEEGNRVDGHLGSGFQVSDQHSWRCIATFPPQPPDKRIRVVTKYRWRNATVLSKAHIDAMPKESRSFFNRQYLEEVFSGLPGMFKAPAFLEISVDLPPRWAPDDLDENVMAFAKQKGQKDPVFSKALTKTIYSNGEGHYLLRINFPDPGTRYYLAWRVRDQPRELADDGTQTHLPI